MDSRSWRPTTAASSARSTRWRASRRPTPATVVITLNRPYAPLLSLLTVFDAPVLPKHVYEGTDPLTNPANEAPDRQRSVPLRRVGARRAGGARALRRLLPGAGAARSPDLPHRAAGRRAQHGARSGRGRPGVGLLHADLRPGAPRGEPGRRRLEGPDDPGALLHVREHRPPAARPTSACARRSSTRSTASRSWSRPRVASARSPAARSAAPTATRTAEATDYRTLYPHDPERARALLAEAGVGDLTLRFVYDSARGAFAAAAEIMRDNLRQVGITLDVQPVERSVMVERVYGRDYDLDAAVVHLGRRPGDRLPPHLPVGGPRHQLRQRLRLRQRRGRPAAQPRPPASPTRARARRCTRRRWRSWPSTCPPCRSSTSSPPRRRTPP